MRNNANSFVPFGARKLGLLMLATGAFVVAYTLLDAPPQAAAAPAVKVEVCHIPPGNPDNFHTITISENAYAAHLAHGDSEGACNDLCATLCNDDDRCTIDDNGNCEEGGCPPLSDRDPVDCSDGNVCTEDEMCDPTNGCLNLPLPGTECDDGNACTDPDTCDMGGQCAGQSIVNCCFDVGDCDDTMLCTEDFCDRAVGDPAGTCRNEGVVCDDPGLCQTGACNETDGSCDYTDVMCDPSTDACSTNECTAESDPECVEVEVPCEPGDHPCTPLLGCEPVDGCFYGEPGPECCVDNGDCATGQACNDDTDTCEPDAPACVTAFDHICDGGDTSALVEDCVQNGDCDESRQCRNAPDQFECTFRSDRDACAGVNDFWQTLGCSICAPPPVPESNCPCWDGSATSADSDVSNVVELWDKHGPETCSSQDCRDTITGGVSTLTFAECLSGSKGMQTSVVSNTNFVDAQCTVWVNGVKLAQVNFPRDSSEAEACIAEHDMLITICGTFPNYSTSQCGLGSF